MELRYGALVEVRLRYGPELKDVAPQYAKQFDQVRNAFALPSEFGGAARCPQEGPQRPLKKCRSERPPGGAMVSILVQVFPPDHRPTEEQGTIIDESIPKALEN